MNHRIVRSIVLLTTLLCVCSIAEAQKMQVKANGMVLNDALEYTGYFSPAKYEFVFDNNNYKIKAGTITIVQEEGDRLTFNCDSNIVYVAEQFIAKTVIVELSKLHNTRTGKDSIVYRKLRIK